MASVRRRYNFMYYEYFGLKQPPFKITPDTSLFFPGGNRGAVLEALIYAITQGEGIVKVVGEVGAGKTMLCRMLQVELPDNVEVVYLANPSLSPENILHAIAFELKLSVTETDNRLKVMNELQNYLLDRHADNRQIVVFIEEAQGMPIATLEEIRLLSNLETTQNKLLQIVLFGQPELDEKIATREIRQLKERITYSFQLAPFKNDDVKDYLNSRMRTCGYRSDNVFSDPAVKAISKYSKGLLRRINILADKALLATYAGNTHKVTSNHVKIAARDSEFVKKKIFLSPVSATIVGLVLLIALGGLVFQENFDQGLKAVQGTLDSEGESTSIHTEAPQREPFLEQQASVGRVPEEPVSEQHVQNLPNPDQGNEGIKVVQEAGMENSPEEDEIKTIYLHQDGERISTSEDVGVDSHENLRLLEEDAPLKIFEPTAIGMTEQEFERFRQQLIELPPEVKLEGTFSEICVKCSSIIYRPVL